MILIEYNGVKYSVDKKDVLYVQTGLYSSSLTFYATWHITVESFEFGKFLTQLLKDREAGKPQKANIYYTEGIMLYMMNDCTLKDLVPTGIPQIETLDSKEKVIVFMTSTDNFTCHINGIQVN